MVRVVPPEPALSNGSIRLEAWRAEQARELMALMDDPEIARFASAPQPYGLEDAADFLGSRPDRWRLGRTGTFAILDCETGALAGSAELDIRSWENRIGEVAYLVGATWRGRGVATGAVRLLCDWGFAELGLERIELLADPRNVGSLRVAEKAGFQREGIMRSAWLIHGERVDLTLHSLLPSDRPRVERHDGGARAGKMSR